LPIIANCPAGNAVPSISARSIAARAGSLNKAAVCEISPFTMISLCLAMSARFDSRGNIRHCGNARVGMRGQE